MKKRRYNCKTLLIGNIFKAYIRVLKTTVNIKIDSIENIKEQQLLGYWHGDSLTMELVLGLISKDIKEIEVIVTADKRGDYIEQIINAYGAKALRLPDGLQMRPFFKDLMIRGKNTKGILAASLDGPLGPLHEPKKLLFLISAKSNKEIVYMEFSYKRVLRLKGRWDNYVILLPFSKVDARIKSLGRITNEELNNFNRVKEKFHGV